MAVSHFGHVIPIFMLHTVYIYNFTNKPCSALECTSLLDTEEERVWLCICKKSSVLVLSHSGACFLDTLLGLIITCILNTLFAELV